MRNKVPCLLAIFFSSAAGLLISGCASSDLDDRLDRRTDAYEDLQDRREMRQDARQERTDAWFDRVMD